MRKEQLIHENWLFRYHDGTETVVNIPHTWNNIDGQDGGDDYYRGTCIYEKDFVAPAFGEDERLYIEFAGVNASTKVIVNIVGDVLCHKIMITYAKQCRSDQ